MQDISYKVILLGDTNTGKTTTIRRYTMNEFIDKHFATPLPIASTGDFNDKYGDYKLNIWDTAGSEDWQSMNSTIYHGSHVVIFLASFDDLESIKNITNVWLVRISEHEDQEKYIPFIAVNKSDVVDNPDCQFDESVCETVRNDLHVNDDHYFEISAKTGDNIKELFEAAAFAARSRFGPHDEDKFTNGDESQPEQNVTERHSCC